MKKQRDIIAAEMAEKLRQGELALESALRRWSEIIAMVPTATAQSGVSLEMGQRIASQAGATVSYILQARGHAVETHSAMATVRDHLGLTTATGPDGEKPPTENGVLMVVGAKAA